MARLLIVSDTANSCVRILANHGIRASIKRLPTNDLFGMLWYGALERPNMLEGACELEVSGKDKAKAKEILARHDVYAA